MELNYGGVQANVPSFSARIGRDVQPTVEERLLIRKACLEGDLKDVNAALEALQANPELLKVMCLISKVNY